VIYDCCYHHHRGNSNIHVDALLYQQKTSITLINPAPTPLVKNLSNGILHIVTHTLVRHGCTTDHWFQLFHWKVFQVVTGKGPIYIELSFPFNLVLVGIRGCNWSIVGGGSRLLLVVLRNHLFTKI